MENIVDTIKFEEGRVTMTGMPFAFTLMKSTYFTYKGLEKVLGKDWKRVVYQRGKNESEESIQGYLSILRKHPSIQKIVQVFHGPLIKFLVYQYNKLGLGILELVKEDPSKPLIILRVRFSPVAQTYLEHEKSKDTVCAELAGSVAGGAGFVYPGIEAVETKCMAKGDRYCEFVLELPKRKQ